MYLLSKISGLEEMGGGKGTYASAKCSQHQLGRAYSDSAYTLISDPQNLT